MRALTPKKKAVEQAQSTRISGPVPAFSAQNRKWTHILDLHNTAGNRAVQRLLADKTANNSATPDNRKSSGSTRDFYLKSTPADERCNIEPKPRSGAVGDKREQKTATMQQMLEGRSLQSDFATGETSLGLKDDISESKTRNGMPAPLRTALEALSGMDLSGIQVHTDSPKPARLNALAYTQGRKIYLAPGQEKHLPHEGWHAVQQMQGRVEPTLQVQSVSINNEPELEREAEAMGAKAMQNASISGNRSDRHAPLRTAAEPGSQATIQRAMKFEYQIQKNRFYRDDGKNVLPLPRKYGPQDYLVKRKSGIRLESETGGQPEFETKWSRNWLKLGSQIAEAHQMTEEMNKAPEIKGSNRITYREFPFSDEIKHLGPGQGFRTKRKTWSKIQKGKRYETNKEKLYVFAEVFPNELDVRKKPGKRFVSVGKLKKGDEVKILRTKGRWLKIEANKLSGWVQQEHVKSLARNAKKWKSRIEQYIPSEKEMEPLWSRETILQPEEKLLVEIKDPYWYAGIQPSESFSLEQFESFLGQKEFRTYSGGTKPVKYISETVSADVDRVMSNFNVTAQSGVLKNFLMMVVYYIKVAGDPDNPVKGKPAKFAFPLMSRTHFGSIFLSLPKEDRLLFKQMVKDKRRGILPTLGLNTGRRLLIKGHGGGKGPTVYQWIDGITRGKDLLTATDLAARDIAAGRKPERISAAMGRFRIEQETGRQKGLVRFEARRSIGNRQPAKKWLEHAAKLFGIAMLIRKRDPGKGKTGLKPK